MKYWLFAATIVFSTFAIVSSLVSLAVARLAPLAAERLERYSAGSRAALLFRVRLLPAVLASIASLAIALPIFLIYEPGDSDESLHRAAAEAGADAVLEKHELARGLVDRLAAARRPT